MNTKIKFSHTCSHQSDMRHKSGFTLIELLLAMTILSIIVTIIAGAFRIGINAWEKGETYTDDQQRYRMVLELMKRQISSLYIGTPDALHPLKGTRKSLNFTSLIPIHPKNHYGIVQVTYDIQNTDHHEHLLVSETHLIQVKDRTNRAPKDDQPLLQNIDEMYFEYLFEKDRKTEWVSEWNSEKEFPKAVKIFFRPSKEFQPITVIVRIQSEIKQRS